MISDKIRKSLSADTVYLSFLPIVLVNTIISCAIASRLLKYGISGRELPSALAAIIPFVAHFFMLNLIIGTPLFLISRLANDRLSVVIRVTVYAIFHAFLIIDVRIYTLFRYHINSLVINVIFTEGAGDSVTFGAGTFISFFIKMILVIAALVISDRYISNIHGRPGSRNGPYIIKAMKVTFIVLIAMIILDKGIYAYGDLFNKVTLTRNAKLLPLYQPLTVKSFAADVLKLNVNREEDISISSSGSILNYPLKELEFDPAGNRNFNIIMIIVDSLRFDMLTRDNMPNLWEYKEENTYYSNHYSGGNGSRFGVFSLIYGINGSYWHNFLAQRQSAVLIDTLIDLGYDFKVLSSTRLTFPEFRKTAFVRIPEHIEDQFEGMDTAERDLIITEKMIDHISEMKSGTPLFGFIFYDAPHQPYHYPPDMEKYSPASDTNINYFKDVREDKILPLKNRYRNAVLYDDALIGRLLRAIEEKGLEKSTVVIITGDHGEEFYENGHFGHTNAFNDYQLRVPLVVHIPGNDAKTVGSLTSHLDIVPTLMELLGCISPGSYYTHGTNLTDPKGRRYIMASKWDKSAVIDNNNVISFSTETYNLGAFEIRNKGDYSEVTDRDRVMRDKKGLLIDVSLKMSEFYR